MKKLIIIFLLFPFLACEEEENPIVTGAWWFYTLDQSNTKPNINATFEITVDDSGDRYLINNLELTIDGIPATGFNSQIEGHGDTLNKIVLSDGQNEISMYGGIFLRTDWVLFDSVVFTQSNVRHWYPGQRLIRP